MIGTHEFLSIYILESWAPLRMLSKKKDYKDTCARVFTNSVRIIPSDTSIFDLLSLTKYINILLLQRYTVAYEHCFS
jgi:hypothetical protein